MSLNESINSKQISLWGLTSRIQKEILIDNKINDIEIDKDEDLKDVKELWFRQMNINSKELFINWLKLNNFKDHDWQMLIKRKFKWQKWCSQNFKDKIHKYYLDNLIKFNQYTYSLLRTSDECLAQELYLRIKENEESFSKIASLYSEGPEKENGGLVGPVSINSCHEKIRNIIENIEIHELVYPTKIDNQYVILRLEKVIKIELTNKLSREIALEIGDQYLYSEIIRNNVNKS